MYKHKLISILFIIAIIVGSIGLYIGEHWSIKLIGLIYVVLSIICIIKINIKE